jgi:flagellar assembly factor FliW
MSPIEPTESALVFDDGIPGFPEARRFTLREVVEGGAFQILQCLEDPDLSLVVAVPWLFFPDYAPELSDVDQIGLELEVQEDAVVFCPVTLDAERKAAHMNLLGPFVVNVRTRKGRQIVLTDQDYPLRAPLPLEAA